MLNLGPLELIVIFVVALLVIGPKRLPDLARALGRAVGEFKRATDELRDNLDINLKSIDINPTPPYTSPTKEEANEPDAPDTEEPPSTEETTIDGQ